MLNELSGRIREVNEGCIERLGGKNLLVIYSMGSRGEQNHNKMKYLFWGYQETWMIYGFR